MSAIADDIKAAIALANDSYAEGYRQGVIAGKREAYAEMKAILDRAPAAADGDTA